MHPQPFIRAEDLRRVYYFRRPNCLLLSVEYIATDIPRTILPLVLLEDTDMTGSPHRPSSTDGHPSVSLLIAIALRHSTLPGDRGRMPVAGARPYRGTLPLGRCGDWSVL